VPHPLDAQRWRAFVVAVKLDGGQVDHACVRGQLVDCGFGPSVVEYLIDSVEDGLELLDLWDIHSALDSSKTRAVASATGWQAPPSPGSGCRRPGGSGGARRPRARPRGW
jgi:hypothetical protein